MIRHPDNTNLIFHRDSTFLGWPIQEDKGPLHSAVPASSVGDDAVCAG